MIREIYQAIFADTRPAERVLLWMMVGAVLLGTIGLPFAALIMYWTGR